MTEQGFVASQFKKYFGDINDPIVLYGVGRNTAAILKNPGNANIIGLMDIEATGQTIYGKPVLSYDEVIETSKVIIIVARQSVVNIIHKRISFLTSKHAIKIYTVNGDLISEKNTEYRNKDLEYWSATSKDLYNEIDRHDVISFDIFDTLIMRKTLKSEDVFELVEQEIQYRYQISINFRELREKSEEQLPHALSTIDEIYEKFSTLSGLPLDIVSVIKNTELEVESRLLITRKCMVEAFNYAKTRGKTVFLTTDMYFTHSHISTLLSSLDITGYDSLLISSHKKKSKEDGSLFMHLKSIAPSSKILHIGDNRIDDIEQAHRNGIDTFYIMSAYELLMASSLQNILSDTSKLQKRLYLGAFVARVFNNPFALHSSKGIIHISQVADLGYLFIGPVIVEFARWLCTKLQDSAFDNVLFPSRDGFLINQIYNELGKSNKNIPKGIYFKTSRRILNAATISSEEDIYFLLKKPYKGSKGELLNTRFGIAPDSLNEKSSDRVDAYTSFDELKQYAKTYKDTILAKSQKTRQRYLQYLQKHHIDPGKTYALFDFISSGTIPFFLGKIFKTELTSFFFASLNMPNELCPDMSKVYSLYGNITPYEKGNNISRHYLFLESVLVDPDTTLMTFDEDLKPVFEPRTSNVWPEIKKVHDGIKELLSDLQSLFYNNDFLNVDEAPEFADELLGYLFSENVYIEEWIKGIFINDDKYAGESPYKAWI
ncbi:MAG: hypothetical protein J7L96_02565 [Bacteroidales bacterium]|nr:hypothetical protein [Bacteroidales bacterium]